MADMSTTFQRIGDELGEWARMRHNEILLKIDKQPRSPIEEILLAGMVGVNVFHNFFEFPGSVSPIPKFSHALVRLQHRIGIYTADFLVEPWVGHRLAGSIVVECDGKYHGQPEIRARDNIRDRFMEDKGFLVMRFSGSEINQNPLAPALEIITACENLIRRAVGEPVDNVDMSVGGEIHPQPSTNDPRILHQGNEDLLRRIEEDLSP